MIRSATVCDTRRETTCCASPLGCSPATAPATPSGNPPQRDVTPRHVQNAVCVSTKYMDRSLGSPTHPTAREPRGLLRNMGISTFHPLQQNASNNALRRRCTHHISRPLCLNPPRAPTGVTANARSTFLLPLRLLRESQPHEAGTAADIYQSRRSAEAVRFFFGGGSIRPPQFMQTHQIRLRDKISGRALPLRRSSSGSSTH